MNPKTREIIDLFEQINAVPRCSKHEGDISRWLRDWAAAHDLAVRHDPDDNLVIDVPATPGLEKAPTVVVQAHMDMVCEKTPDSDHDFSRDPIRMIEEGDWLTADGTTLGADNGLAVALMLVLARDPDVPHPHLELLITVDEESGLNGALKLRSGFVQGRILLNVDSEEEGVFTIGCAGSRHYDLTRTPETESLPPDGSGLRLVVDGLRGGHSGLDIGRGRGSANVVMARILDRIGKAAPLRLITMSGGTGHNVIARRTEAVVAVPTDNLDTVMAEVMAAANALVAEYVETDPKLRITATPHPMAPASAALTETETRAAVQWLLALPHGPDDTILDAAPRVETSSNLAIVRFDANRLYVLTSHRSCRAARLDAICQKTLAIAGLAGADIACVGAYPPWEPRPESPLLTRCREVYTGLFGHPATERIIHAGLECAVIGDIYEGMDMISFGPTMLDQHSPDERLSLPSVDRLWDFTVRLLGAFE